MISELQTNNSRQYLITPDQIRSKLLMIRDCEVILASDVAEIYGVPTKRVNEAVNRNADKFPADYCFQLTAEEHDVLRSQNATSSWGGTRHLPKVFTEKGLYMLATVLKSPLATSAAFAIIETFAMVRTLRKELVEFHKETNQKNRQGQIRNFGNLLSQIVMPDLEPTESESSLEINFFIGKIKHTVKRIKKKN